MKLRKRTGESVHNLIGNLEGAAWKVVEDFGRNNLEKVLDSRASGQSFCLRQRTLRTENVVTHCVRKPEARFDALGVLQ